MILAIDMGNTNTVIGGIDEEKTYFIERVTTDQNRTDTEYAVAIKNVLEMHQIHSDSIEGAILSSVVPPLNSTILRAVEKAVGVSPLLVGPGIKTGVNILMDNPKTVGSDMIVDVVAARHEHPCGDRYGYCYDLKCGGQARKLHRRCYPAGPSGVFKFPQRKNRPAPLYQSGSSR